MGLFNRNRNPASTAAPVAGQGGAPQLAPNYNSETPHTYNSETPQALPQTHDPHLQHNHNHNHTVEDPAHHSKHHHNNHASNQRHSGFGGLPSFGQWLKLTALDLLTMLVMGMIGLGVYFADPAPSRSFPVTFKDGEIVYPQFSYPLRKEIIPIWVRYP
jgi:hypothetical protein